jgi:hypothetical protein
MIMSLVELDDHTLERLRRLANREGVSLDELLERMLALYGSSCD